MEEKTIFDKAGHDIDYFAMQHSESRDLTIEEVKNIKALSDTAITYSFGQEIILGMGRSSCYSALFKIEDGSWILWDTDERRGFYHPEQFGNSNDACIGVIKRYSDKELIEEATEFYKQQVVLSMFSSSIKEFADEMNYTVVKPMQLGLK